MSTFLVFPVVVLMVLVAVLVVLAMDLGLVKVVASHHCYQYKKNTVRTTKSATMTTKTSAGTIRNEDN